MIMEAPHTEPAEQLPPDDVAAIDELGRTYQAFRQELAKVIIGQDEVIDQAWRALGGERGQIVTAERAQTAAKDADTSLERSTVLGIEGAGRESAGSKRVIRV